MHDRADDDGSYPWWACVPPAMVGGVVAVEEGREQHQSKEQARRVRRSAHLLMESGRRPAMSPSAMVFIDADRRIEKSRELVMREMVVHWCGLLTWYQGQASEILNISTAELCCTYVPPLIVSNNRRCRWT